MKTKLSIGPSIGMEQNAVLYCLDADEPSMLQEEHIISGEDLRALDTYTKEISLFALSALSITQEDDRIILDEEFLKYPEYIPWLQHMYANLGLHTTKKIYYLKPNNYYESVKEIIKESELDQVCTTCISHALNKTFNVQSLLDASIKLNSKTKQITLAEKYGFNIPHSILTPTSAINKTVLKKFDFPNKPVFMKQDGLGGGTNVKKISTDNELEEFKKTSETSKETLIQAAIPDTAISASIAYGIYTDHYNRINTRLCLAENSVWFGNYFLPNLCLPEAHIRILDNVAKAAQGEGYKSAEGLIIGCDFFITKETCYVIDINARWLGHTPAEHLLKRIKILNKYPALLVNETIHKTDLKNFQNLNEKYLFSEERYKSFGFSCIPLGISPYENKDKHDVAMLIVGDIYKCYEAFSKVLTKSSLSNILTSDKIIKESITNLRNMFYTIETII